MTLSPFRVDLHLHTVLSPCGELEMGAPEIVAAYREEGIALCAVTDHNAADNVPAVAAAAQGNPVVIPGMEVQSAEDIHLVVLFPDMETARSYQEWLWKEMPSIPNNPEIFGEQLIIDGENQIIGEQQTLLVQGVGYGVDVIAEEALARGCLVIPAHLNRPSFSYEAVFGPLPDDFPCSALELSSAVTRADFQEWRRRYPGRLFIRSSDAHRLREISKDRCTVMMLETPSFSELVLALKGQEGRSVLCPWEDFPSDRASSSA